MQVFAEPYAPRTIRFLGFREQGGWRLKVYGITYRGEVPSPALVERAWVVARRELPRPAVDPDRYGVGFVGIHEGRGANLVFLDWWARGNELHHLVWVADHRHPLDLQPIPRGGPHACIWDLAVIAFERTAWVASALLNPNAPDLDGYLESTFQGVV